MVSAATWLRYISHKLEYAVSLSVKGYREGIIADKQVGDVLWKNFFQGKLTFITHWNKGGDMAPTIGPQGGTLLVRKIPKADSSRVFIGDVVVLRDPDSGDYLVRRLTAVEGYEMVSTDEEDEPFVLEKDQCWVVADNENIKPKQEANDSRTFGPVSMSSIVGRVIYCLRNAVDHGPVNNSKVSVEKDTPVLEIELDVDEMAKSHKE